MFRHHSVGCITCRMFFPSSFTPFAFSLRVQLPEWSVQPFVAVPGVNSLASVVTLMYSFQLTQTSASMTVLICVVCLRFCFPRYSTLCLSWPLFIQLRVPMVRFCCPLSLGSYSWLFTIGSINDEVILFYFCEHIPPSRSMLGIVLIKYSGNVWL